MTATKRQKAAMRNAFEAWLKTADADGMFEPPPVVPAVHQCPVSPLAGFSARDKRVVDALFDLSRAIGPNGPPTRDQMSPLAVLQDALVTVNKLRGIALRAAARADRLEATAKAATAAEASMRREVERLRVELAETGETMDRMRRRRATAGA